MYIPFGSSKLTVCDLWTFMVYNFVLVVTKLKMVILLYSKTNIMALTFVVVDKTFTATTKK